MMLRHVCRVNPSVFISDPSDQQQKSLTNNLNTTSEPEHNVWNWTQRLNLNTTSETEHNVWTWTQRLNLNTTSEPEQNVWTWTQRLNLNTTSEPEHNVWTWTQRVNLKFSEVKLRTLSDHFVQDLLELEGWNFGVLSRQKKIRLEKFYLNMKWSSYYIKLHVFTFPEIWTKRCLKWGSTSFCPTSGWNIKYH